MRGVILQLWDEPEIAEWAFGLGQAMNLLAGAVGAFIAYQAYRGYRRNRSRPMLFIAIGFALAIGVPFALLPVFLVAPASAASALYLLQQAVQVAGLLTILYALRL